MTDWTSSILIAYAKGARTFERHVDIDDDGVEVSPYNTLPAQADVWFKAFHKAKEMCGASAEAKRKPPQKEVRYLDELVRGVYARRDLKAGDVLTDDDVYLAVPLQHGQLSCREFSTGEMLKAPMSRDEPVLLRDIDSDYANDLTLQRLLADRGVADAPVIVDAPVKRVAYG
jgi:N-acetylneuraminate synthase